MLLKNSTQRNKIVNLYDTSINTINVTNTTDVSLATQDLQNSYDYVVTENQALKDSLSQLINVVESKQSIAEIIAQKDLILNLRIQLGQGTSVNDFSVTFPYEKV